MKHSRKSSPLTQILLNITSGRASSTMSMPSAWWIPCTQPIKMNRWRSMINTLLRLMSVKRFCEGSMACMFNPNSNSLCMYSNAYNSLKWVTCHLLFNKRNLNRNSRSIQSICRLRQHHLDNLCSSLSPSTAATLLLFPFRILKWQCCLLLQRCPRWCHPSLNAPQ